MRFIDAKIVQVGADPAEYHSEPNERGNPAFVVGSGTLRTIAQCPRRWRFGYEPPPSESKEWGALIDCLFLTPQDFNKRYVVRPMEYETTVLKCPDCGSVTESDTCRKCKRQRHQVKIKKPWNGNASECVDCIERWMKEGKEVISQADFDASEQALRRLNRDPIIKAFVEASDRQVWLEAKWKDSETGLLIPIKCLIDLCPRKDTEFAACLGDLKTTRNAGVPQFARFCYQMGYHLQAALYTDVYEAITGEGRESWCWVLCENYAPFETAKRLCSQDLLNVGRMEYKAALRTYAQCLATDEWPGYDSGPDAVQGWTLVDADEWMKQKAFMLGAQAEPEPEPEPETEDVIP